MRTLLLVFALVAIVPHAQARIVCRGECSGTVEKVVDASFKETPDFKDRCSKQNGRVVRSSGVPYDGGFDQMGCYVVKDRMGYEISHYYCVVEIEKSAFGIGITGISKENGGTFTASNDADESCRSELQTYVCSEQFPKKAKNVKWKNWHCEEF